MPNLGESFLISVAIEPAPTGLNAVASAAGGTIPAGTYYYAIAAMAGASEGPLGPDVGPIVLTGATSSVVLTWNQVPGASGYRIYRGTAPGVYTAGFIVAGAVGTITDTGAALTAGTGKTGTTATYVPVSDMNKYGRKSGRDVSKYPAFGRVVPHSVPGARTQGISISGFATPADPGQDALLDTEAIGSTIFARVWPNGGSTNGFQQEFQVLSFTHDASPEGLQEISFELTAVGPATIIGAGPIL
jgi:hypothetical protein